MKDLCKLLLIVLLLFSLSRCNERGNNTNIEYLNNIRVDNSIDIKSATDAEYDLYRLNDFFGVYSSQEKSAYGIKIDKEDLSIEKVNSIFPIQIMRYSGNNYYSVYKVRECGLYYVFWLSNDDGVFVSDTFYISKLKQKIDFDVLQIGISTYKDVYETDPSSEIVLILSNGVYSYSLLDDGNILQIEYSFTDLKSREDLIVKSINVVSRKLPHGSKIETIYLKDLP